MQKLIFTKNGVETSWMDPTAFPTVETNETNVRSDIQLFFDEIKAVLNANVDELEGEGGAAAITIAPITGMTATSVQGAVEELHGNFADYATQSYVQSAIAAAIGDAIGGAY